MDPEIKIKMTREGVDQAANDLKKVEKASADTAKAMEKNTEKVFKTSEAFKKLGREIPLVGSALDALKNPFTTVGILGAMAVRTINDYISAIDKMAESAMQAEGFANKIATAFDLVAKQKQEAAAFAEKIKAIGQESKDAAQWLKEQNTQIERLIKLEGELNPNANKQDLERRRLALRGQAADNAARRAQEESARAQAALPAARETLTAERRNARQVVAGIERGDQESVAREEFLIAQNKEIESNLGRPALLRKRLSADPLYTSRSTEDLQSLLEQNRTEMVSISAGRSMRAGDRVKAEGRVASAETVVQSLEAKAIAAAQAAQGFRGDAAEQFGAADFGRPAVDNLGRGSAQFRYDAQRGNLLNQGVRRDAQEAAKLVGDAIREVIVPLINEIKTIRQSE